MCDACSVERSSTLQSPSVDLRKMPINNLSSKLDQSRNLMICTGIQNSNTQFLFSVVFSLRFFSFYLYLTACFSFPFNVSVHLPAFFFFSYLFFYPCSLVCVRLFFGPHPNLHIFMQHFSLLPSLYTSHI